MESIAVNGASVNFRAERDAGGTPHVVAETWLDALYGLGYLHALDRPTQIFFSRAVACGQAAERIANKPELVETDKFFRRVGLHLHLEREVNKLTDSTRRQLGAYCEGVNDALQAAGRSLPMWVAGFHPRPWNPEAVLSIGNLLSFAGLAVAAQENERIMLELVQSGVKPELLRELMEPYLNKVDFEPLQEITMQRELSDDALEMLADLPRLAGSNAWAVAPRRSASGEALLASDPHLEVNRLPAIWYEVALNWGDGEYAMGATLPGCPLMAVGRTRRLAWGVTYLHADTSDYFAEDCRVDESGDWQYRRNDQWHDFEIREEEIRRKGTTAEIMKVYENSQGTMRLDLTDREPGKYLSASWIGSEEGGGRSIGCYLDVIGSHNVREAMDTVRESSHPTLVWVFADSEGHIGRQASGWLPLRMQNEVGLLPNLAWHEHFHWQGIQPSSDLPSLYDPPEGYLCSANENLDRAGEQLIHCHALPEYRKWRIAERLHEMQDATVEDMQRLQYDFHSLQAKQLLAVFLPHIPSSPFRDLLVEWDCNYDPESTAATMFQHLYRHVLLELFGHKEGIGWRRMFYLCTRMGYSTMILAALDRLLLKEESLWWTGRDKGLMIREAALRAAEEEAVPWGEANSFHFANRFFESESVGRLLGFHSSKKAMPGCQATVFQGHLLTTATRESSFAPSYHFVTDMAVDRCWTNIPGGASESRFSKWYRTDIERWLVGEYRQLIPSLETDEG